MTHNIFLRLVEYLMGLWEKVFCFCFLSNLFVKGEKMNGIKILGAKRFFLKIENIVRGERRKSQICNVFSCNFLYDGVPDIALRY